MLSNVYRTRLKKSPVTAFPLESVTEITVSVTGFPLASGN